MLNSLANKLMRHLSPSVEGSDTKLANSVWYQNGLTLSNEYRGLMNGTYYAETNEVDFTSQQGVDLINAWVRLKTDNMIEKCIDSPRSQAAMLINAMSFNGKWAAPFDPDATSKKVFHSAHGDNDVDMMSQNFSPMSGEDDNYKIATLPFKSSSELIIVMPKKHRHSKPPKQ